MNPHLGTNGNPIESPDQNNGNTMPQSSLPPLNGPPAFGGDNPTYATPNPSMIANPYVQAPVLTYNSNPEVVMVTPQTMAIPLAQPQPMYNADTGMTTTNVWTPEVPPKLQSVIVQQPMVMGQASDPSVIYPDPNGMNAIPMQRGVQDGAWKAGLFSCFEPSVGHFFMGLCCPCFPTAQIVARTNSGKYEVFLIVLGVFTMMNILCSQHELEAVRITPSVLLMIVSMPIIYSVRRKVQRVHRIPSDSCNNILISSFCQLCAVLQMANHLNAYEGGQCSGPKALPEFIEA